MHFIFQGECFTTFFFLSSKRIIAFSSLLMLQPALTVVCLAQMDRHSTFLLDARSKQDHQKITLNTICNLISIDFFWYQQRLKPGPFLQYTQYTIHGYTLHKNIHKILVRLRNPTNKCRYMFLLSRNMFTSSCPILNM